MDTLRARKLGGLRAVGLVIALAADYSIETRIRRLLVDHEEAGDRPRTLVMNIKTWHKLVGELEGRTYSDQYFWTPMGGRVSAVDPLESITTFRGVPILIKDFVADEQILVGV